MAINVRACREERMEKIDQCEKHKEIPKDSPTGPSVIGDGSRGQEWKSPQTDQNMESQGSNDRGLALAERKSESEASKGQLPGQPGSVEVTGSKGEVNEEKKEVLTQGEESLQQ